MHLKIANLLTSKTFIHILYRFIRAYSWTFRLTVENEKPWMEHVESGGRVLLCCWHQQFFSFIRYFQKYSVYQPSLMISQSSDGEMIAGVANLTGWHTVRGSSSKNGQQALQQMIQRLRTTGLAAHIVDGPRGPVGIVKKGAIYLAKDAEAMIVTVHSKAKKAWYFNSWDRFFLPKPFSKVVIRFGELIKVHKTDEINVIEKLRKNLEEIMLPALHQKPH
jgi:lysophospholipid acyltransferase (LPLAT)-like uncharacterized protein